MTRPPMTDANTSPLEWLLERISFAGAASAVATGDSETPYHELAATVERWRSRLLAAGVLAGDVVSIEGEYAAPTIAALLAAADLRAIVVPLSADMRVHHDRFRRIAQVQWRVSCAAEEIVRCESRAVHPHFDRLRAGGRPGLVLFTSGSTGEGKAAVHDLGLLLEKFHVRRQSLRTLVFLQLDHIGGVNTLLYTLANSGAIIVPADRSPAAVCRAIERHRVELLPASPTFLNLLLLSEEPARRDLSSLRLITYGTEPMPPSTLSRLHAAFPGVKLQQTYGLTELGILRSQSRGSDSLWVRVGGEGYETKVVDGRLWIRARSGMLGYLNADSPFDAEGFFDTGDRVEVDGPWLRILGRQSEVINVGGSKVDPAAVESVLLEMDGVAEAAVRGEPHPITGQIVAATVRLARDESPRDFRVRMRSYCRDRLPDYAVPARVSFGSEPLHSVRFKCIRRGVDA